MTSTGKDSMVTLDLVQRFIPDIKVYFNNTSLDVGDTYRIVKKHKDWTIINPPYGFYQWVKFQDFIPSIFSRACCSIFKEGTTVDYFPKENKMLLFLGIRNDESQTRQSRQDIDHNPKWGSRDWYSCQPIRKWNELMVWIYMFKYNLETNSVYKKGYSRAGCAVACPYQGKYQWALDEYWHPFLRNKWINTMKDYFIRNQKWCTLNCTVDEFAQKAWKLGTLRPEPNDEVINEFMKYKGLTDRNVALQYFNKTCCVCGKNVRQNDVLGMNLKLHSREVEKIYCKKHLMELHNMSAEEWDKNVADFKAQGCKLF